MKFFATLAVIVTTATQVAAHYRWNSLTINGVKTGDWQYVRESTNNNSPVTTISSTDLTCNVGGQSGGTTQTATIPAGSTVTFNLDKAIYHHGVINVYMAKAPATAVSFNGAGNVWFKIAQLSAVTDGGKTITWPADNLTSFTFKIPATLPAGEYLIRIEHIGLHNAASSGPEFFISCAQAKITGTGTKTPSPLVPLPGYYTGKESGLTLDIYWPVPTTYTQPGPAVWSG
ncbi:glycoside hydrolase family 61 protein [Ceratobasidium sp. AG-Ba]|nr:glycoside hydrolase family 61 protein [Ceratobasidium sp. AG-Ba]